MDDSIISISGNPTDEELAALISAVNMHFSSLMSQSVDKVSADLGIWQALQRNSRSKNTHLSGNTRNWSIANRIKSRS